MNTRIKLVLAGVSVLVFVLFWPTQLGGDTEFLIVQGQSMLPTILPGSLVVIKEAPSYQINDIVAYDQKSGRLSQIVVHRIMEKTDQGFVIQGDNNPKKDAGYPTNNDIRGKVIFATPYMGDLMGLLRNPIVLIVTALAMGGVQMEQDRRKKRKERIRRIRLRLPPLTKVKSKENAQKKPKKPNYSLFFVAIAFNIFTYFAVQFSLDSGIVPKGDMITGFLYNMFAPSFASTLSFAVYFLFIFGLYFAAKYYQAKSFHAQANPYQKKLVQVVVTKKSNLMLGVASFLWILFTLMSLFHLLAIASDLSIINSIF